MARVLGYGCMSVLYVTHQRFADHDTGPCHPERPSRLIAVDEGIDRAGLREAVVPVTAVPAPDEVLEGVHPTSHRLAISNFSMTGGGYIDGDTHVGIHSWEAARLAAGAGIETIRRLELGEGSVGFCAIRPPGHHALSQQAMGFCLMNNVAVAAAHLADRGERVLVVDYDAHHGNGTQDIFWNDPRVFYVSLHEWPLFPGTGHLSEIGGEDARLTTMNFPLPAGATGDVYRRAIDDVIGPAVTEWDPTWLLLSAGFDGHRRDPITDLGLTSGDFADITRVLAELVPAGRLVIFLEGGYDLEALSLSTGSMLSALVDDGAYRPEHPTSGGPGEVVSNAVLKNWAESADG